MGCKCCWGHEGFASLKERFDPVTVHHMFCIASSIGRVLVSKTSGSGFESLAVRQVFVREWCRGNTTDFDSVVLGSIPSSRASFVARLVKWYNGRLISVYYKFNSCTEHQFLFHLSILGEHPRLLTG